MEPLLVRTPIDAPREVLWDYISTAGGLACWQADTVEGGLAEGHFSLRWPQLGARMDLSVAEYSARERLVLRTGGTALAMTLGDGELLLEHHGLVEEDDWVGLESSWRAALSVLNLAVTRHPRKSRHVRWLFQPIVASAELVHHYFTDPRGLGEWLGATSTALKDGERYRLDINHQLLTGRVLCAQRDVCLQVSEWRDAALTLRTLPAPEDTRVAAVGVSTWNHPISEQLTHYLEASLSRLARAAHCGQG